MVIEVGGQVCDIYVAALVSLSTKIGRDTAPHLIKGNSL